MFEVIEIRFKAQLFLDLFFDGRCDLVLIPTRPGYDDPECDEHAWSSAAENEQKPSNRLLGSFVHWMTLASTMEAGDSAFLLRLEGRTLGG